MAGLFGELMLRRILRSTLTSSCSQCKEDAPAQEDAIVVCVSFWPQATALNEAPFDTADSAAKDKAALT